MLRQQLALRYSHRMLNASAQNEDGVYQFSPTCHKWVTIATSLELAVAITIYYYKVYNLLCTCWKFGEHQSRNSGKNNANVRIFT